MNCFWAARADWQASAKNAPDANDTHMRTVLAGHAARIGRRPPPSPDVRTCRTSVSVNLGGGVGGVGFVGVCVGVGAGAGVGVGWCWLVLVVVVVVMVPRTFCAGGPGAGAGVGGWFVHVSFRPIILITEKPLIGLDQVIRYIGLQCRSHAIRPRQIQKVISKRQVPNSN